LHHPAIVSSHDVRQDLFHEFLDARPLNQFYGRDLDPKRGFQSVHKRHRHQRIEPKLAERANRIDRFGDA
jgi:hypothetical protein